MLKSKFDLKIKITYIEHMYYYQPIFQTLVEFHFKIKY